MRVDDWKRRHPSLAFLRGLARAYGGAVIFSLPMMMTMEMWWVGFYMPPHRMIVMMLVSVPLFAGLSYLAGFRTTFNLVQDTIDGLTAIGVGFVASAVGLWLFGLIGPHMSADEIVGKIAVQAVPAGFGALLAQAQLGGGSGPRGANPTQRTLGYWWELFMMAIGALFLAYNVAPTEEMILIAYKDTPWLSVLIVLVSLLVMHAFVYALEFQGQATPPTGMPFWAIVLRYTVTGYAVALLVSVASLWLFGRIEGTGVVPLMHIVVVLGFPAAVGAAAARLIL